VTLTATASDAGNGDANVTAGEYHVDTLGAAGDGTAMSPADSVFDHWSEDLTAVVDTSGWGAGVHTLYVNARDALGNWGAAVSIDVTVDPRYNFTVSGIPATPGLVLQGDADVMVEQLDFSAASGSVDLLTLTLLGTVSGAGNVDIDVTQVKIYQDAGAGGWQGPGVDLLVVSGFFHTVDKDVTLDVSGITVDTGGTTLFVAYDIAPAATYQDVLGVDLTALTYAPTGNLSPDPLPLSSGPVKTVDATSDTTPPTVGTLEINDGSGPQGTPATIIEGTASVTLTAIADDTGLGDSIIAAGEYFVDGEGTAGTGVAMSAANGAFNEVIETLTAVVDTSGWTAGTYTIDVDARDAGGNWGPANAPSITVIVDPKHDFTVATESGGGQDVLQNDADILMEKLTFTAAAVPVDLLTLTLTGTLGAGTGAVDQDVAQIKIHEDTNGNGTFENPGDAVLDTGSLHSVTKDVTLDVSGVTVPTSPGKVLFVVVDVAPLATAGDVFGMELSAVTSMATAALSTPLPLTSGNIKTVAVEPPALNCGDCHLINAGNPSTGAHLVHKDKTGPAGEGENDITDCYACHTDNAAGGGYATTPSGTHNDGSTTTVAALGYSDNATPGVYTDDTCATNTCHSGATATTFWADTSLACDACHYQADPPDATNNTAHGATIGDSHNAHFAAGANSVACTVCHPNNIDLSHITITASDDGGILTDMATADPSVDEVELVAVVLGPQGVNPIPGVNPSCDNTQCHDPTNSDSVYSATWTVTNASCGLCHAATPATGSHSAHLGYAASYVCADCHTDNTGNFDHTLDSPGIDLPNQGYAAGSCATGTCHNTASNPAWGDRQGIEITDCTVCHGDAVADTNDFDGQNKAVSEIMTGAEWTAGGHGAQAVACAGCHDIGEPHDSSASLNGGNPFRLKDQDAGTPAVIDFSCSYATGCHTGATSRFSFNYADIKTHDPASFDSPNYAPWAWVPECVNCHDPHGDQASGALGPNNSMIQKEVYDKAAFNLPLTSGQSPTAAPTEQTDLEFTSYAGNTVDGKSYTDADAPKSSLCQECHEGTPGADTTYAFTDDARANWSGHPAYTSAETDNPNDCSACHKHDTAFKPSGCSGRECRPPPEAHGGPRLPPRLHPPRDGRPAEGDVRVLPRRGDERRRPRYRGQPPGGSLRDQHRDGLDPLCEAPRCQRRRRRRIHPRRQRLRRLLRQRGLPQQQGDRHCRR
jgi:hypothetical protein